MTLVVQKYGGTSVATPERLQLVAQRIRDTVAGGSSAVVVVSAMGDTTDDLIRLAHSVSADPPEREMDALLSTGEVITAPLLAMALAAADVPAVSLTGPQAGIRTTRAHRSARITDIVPVRVIEELEQGRVVVVAGFQGSTENMDIATLGRGGSDTSAVALAVALHAEHCEILTDVAGVFTADPRVEPSARVIPEITYEEMLEMAAAGARVMHPRAVEIGEAYSMPIRVLSSFEDGPGTLICRHPRMEQRQKVRGIAHETDLAKVTLLRVPDRPGVAASTFGPFGEAGINVDIIVQNVSHDGTTDLSFTIGQSDLKRATALLEDVARTVGAEGFATDSDIAQVSVIGTGIRGTPGMFAKIFRTLAESGVNIQMISSSEIDITCIIDRASVREAVRALHHAFELEKI
ncbi:MAG: aspartate kinase [Candidatus Dormibacteraeota bacterium]|nr:aspartate kinase [Candidatus Dormibacteraeota bacterium]